MQPRERETHPLVLRLVEAKRAAKDAMTPGERAELELLVKDGRATARERRRERHELRRLAVSMWLDGASIDDIAEATGWSPSHIVAVGAGLGISISRSPVNRCLAASVIDGRIEALGRAAADHGATARQTLQDLLTFAMDDDAAILRRVLRIVKGGAA